MGLGYYKRGFEILRKGFIYLDGTLNNINKEIHSYLNYFPNTEGAYC